LRQENNLATLDPEKRKFSELGRVTGNIKEIVVHIDGWLSSPGVHGLKWPLERSGDGNGRSRGLEQLTG